PPDGFFCDVFCWRRLTIDFLTANKVILYRAQFNLVRVLNKFCNDKVYQANSKHITALSFFFTIRVYKFVL
ncbi:hypothetical protein QTO02_16375, partial [Vibrio fortis]